MRVIKEFLKIFLNATLLLTLLIFSVFLRYKTRRKIIFSSTPILNNKYWSRSLKSAGFESETIMKCFYEKINKIDDYDKYFDDLIPTVIKNQYVRDALAPFFVWLYIIKNAKIVVIPFHGIAFEKYFWKFEYLLIVFNNIKTIVIPYGSDAYMYSRITDKSFHNCLLINYPNSAKYEKYIESKVFFWSQKADCVVCGFMGCDGMPRWDILVCSYLQIDTTNISFGYNKNISNGKNGVVKIVHSPNHRGVKGTEYLLKVVEELKSEGFNLDLILMEKIQNDTVLEVMKSADILAEQFIGIGYGLSAIEGMASGLPVLSNLDNEAYTTVFRRYSFLNECPILSTTPETLKENLRILIENPELRDELGRLGRMYVEKYHSYKAAQYMFTNIFKKLEGEDIDLINLYHPLKSDYVKNNYIKTPLIKNKLAMLK